MENVVIGGHVGFRFNGDGKFQGVDLTGQELVRGGCVRAVPLANQVSFVGEVRTRPRASKADPGVRRRRTRRRRCSRAINWTAFPRGTFRGAVAGGLTDGAPDFRVLLGYAFHF